MTLTSACALASSLFRSQIGLLFWRRCSGRTGTRLSFTVVCFFRMFVKMTSMNFESLKLLIGSLNLRGQAYLSASTPRCQRVVIRFVCLVSKLSLLMIVWNFIEIFNRFELTPYSSGLRYLVLS